MQELAKKDFENLRQDSDDSEPQPKVVRRGRPPGKVKKSIERSPFDRVGPEFSSDATLASGGDNTSLSNGYNLRRTTTYKHQHTDTFVRASHGSHSSETYATWLSEWENEFPGLVWDYLTLFLVLYSFCVVISNYFLTSYHYPMNI